LNLKKIRVFCGVLAAAFAGGICALRRAVVVCRSRCLVSHAGFQARAAQRPAAGNLNEPIYFATMPA
jgi:hypothetical protein